jgi:TonB family protein
LLDRINSIGFEQVRQRVGMSYYLRSLSKPETNLYIKKRLEISGAHNSSLFSESAIDEVFNYSKGTPRVINTICDNALLFGAAEKSAHIDAHIVRRVVESLYLQQSVDPHNSMPYDTEDGDSEDTMEGMPRQGEEVSPYVRIAHLQDAHPFDQRPAFGWREQRSRQRLTVFVTAAGLAIVLLSGLLLARVEFVQQALATLTDRLVGYTGKGTESTVQPETKPPADPAARPAPLSPDTSSGLPTPTLVDPGAGKTSPGASRPASTVPVVQDVPVRFVAKPEPEYPPLARRLGWEGTPILLLELRADGTVGEVNVVASSNYPVLDEAAKQAVKKWTHIPPRRDGVAVTQWITQSIPFKLSEAPLVGQNETIRAVQERLKSAGFYPGPVDGLLGPRTREAVLRYQESRSLPVSGEIDKATKTALGLE